MFYNKDKNTNRLNALAQALSSAKSGNNNASQITAFQPIRVEEQKSSDNMDQLLGGGMKLFNGLNDSGLLSKNSFGGNTNSEISSAVNNNVFGSGESISPLSSAINSNVMGNATDTSALSGAISSEAPALGASGGGASIGSALPWGMIANTGKSLYNNISGHSPSEYSDLEQSTIYPIQGAANGFSLGGPWGALGGALYGLGYSFKDDIGLKDSNFLTQMLFPIGMGDGGGLRISGEPILDIL
jgi:hypothetical protein